MSPNRAKDKTLNNLVDLEGVRDELELSLDLEIPEDDIVGRSEEELEARAEPVRKKIEEIEGWMPSAFVFLYRTIPRLSDEARENVEDQEAKVRSTFDSIFDHKKKAIRRRGFLYFFKCASGLDLRSQEQVEDLLSQLVQDGRLEKATEETRETIRVYDQLFRVPDRAEFRLAEQVETRRFLRELVWRADEAETKKDLSWQEYRDKKAGRITLGVPPEEVPAADGNDENTFWRPGCQLRMRSDGKDAIPVRAIAKNVNFNASLELAIAMKVRLPLNSLGEEKPPHVSVIPRGADPKEYIGKTHLLWFCHKRAEAALLKKEELRRSIQKMALDLVTVDPKGFFLEGETGVTKVELDQPWEERDAQGEVTEVIYDVCFFPERFVKEVEGEDVTFIRLASEGIPPHMQDYFGSCVGEYPEREKFMGLPYPFGAMLQANYGKVLKAAQIEGDGDNDNNK